MFPPVRSIAVHTLIGRRGCGLEECFGRWGSPLEMPKSRGGYLSTELHDKYLCCAFSGSWRGVEGTVGGGLEIVGVRVRWRLELISFGGSPLATDCR